MRRWGWIGAVGSAGALFLSASAQQPSGFELPAKTEERLRVFLAKTFCERERADPGAKYSSAQIALGLNDAPLILVYLNDNGYCGSGGCHLFLYRDADSSFEEAADIIPVSKPVIGLLPTRTDGWRDLVVGISEGSTGVFPARVRHSSEGYAVNWDDYEIEKKAGRPTGAIAIFNSYGDKPLCRGRVS